ncbi:MAG: ATP-binding cassette domain-containing protein [Geminicoccaceae bacterium]|nr:ATP-binding cassette domain-containing protein [Geminicoccaceae bacterium]
MTGPAGLAIRLEHVRFVWPGRTDFVLEVPLFEVGRGERLLLTGPSGSGKSTLLSLIAGVIVPGSGSVQVLGHRLEALGGPARDRFRAANLGIIFQMFNLLPYLSVLDNVLLPLSFAPARRARAEEHRGRREEAGRLLARLEVEPALWHEHAATLSVGQQQRVAAARALIGRPEIVIADEPTSALDRDRQHAFLELLMNELAQSGGTLLMVSHDQSLTPRFERVLGLADVVRQERSAAIGRAA